MSASWPPSGGGSGGITSINGDATPAQLITAGTGITVTSAGGTTTISTGGGGGWTPASITGGITLWLDASDATTINLGSPTNGALVSAWRDKSGNSNNFAQSSSTNQPVYTTNTLNSLAGILFSDSSGSSATCTGMTSSLTVAAASSLTILAVFTFNAYGPPAGTLTALAQLGVSGGGLCPYISLCNLSGRQYAGLVGPTGWPNKRSADTFSTLGRAYNMAITYPGNGSTVQLYSANVPLTMLSNTQDWSAGATMIGSLGLSYGLVGAICEMVLAPSVISSTDLSSWQTYVTNKWGSISA